MTATETTLAPETLVALAKSLEKRAANVKLAPGRYPVDAEVLVRVHGYVKRADDTTTKPTAKVLSLDTLAYFLSKLGATRPGVVREFVRLATEYVNGGPDVDANVTKAVRAELEAAIDALPLVPRAGATTADVDLEIVGRPEAVATYHLPEEEPAELPF